jgi:hypothetical protein
MSTFLMADWTFFTETKFCTCTSRSEEYQINKWNTNGGDKNSPTPEEKMERLATCGLCNPSASGVCC